MNSYDELVTRSFHVFPEQLDDRLLDTLQTHVEQYCTAFCSSKHGYILRFSHIVGIENGIVSTITGKPMFKPQFYVKYFKPEIGQVYNTQFSAEYEHGIFVVLYGRIRVFIPRQHCCEIVNNHRVPVCIVETRYKNNNIDCIGKIIH